MLTLDDEVNMLGAVIDAAPSEKWRAAAVALSNAKDRRVSSPLPLQLSMLSRCRCSSDTPSTSCLP